MWKIRIFAIVLLLAGFGVGYFNYSSEIDPNSQYPFSLGLDLSGGTHLVYQTDISKVDPFDVRDSMNTLQDVIERRVNLFGVSEPVVQIEEKGAFKKVEDRNYRLIVELPGVTDINQAVSMIGKTPLLEFKTERPEGTEKEAIIKALQEAQAVIEAGGSPQITSLLLQDPYFLPTELTGRYLERAQLTFDQNTSEPQVSLVFNKEGSDLFAEITKENIGKVVAIYLDGNPISTPVVRSEITGGRAEISGGFTPEEARELVRNLNFGALPVPIELLTTQTIGASLGEQAAVDGVQAGILGLIAVAIFMFIWYRLPGILAIISLGIYLAMMLALFKLIPVTLTAAGITGFILSIGMAVDANILIFERTKEELRAGRNTREAIREGFARAWLSIRDANISSIITAVILFWFGTSLIKGFALTFGLGVLISMISAITVTRTFLLAVSKEKHSKFTRFLFGTGLKF